MLQRALQAALDEARGDYAQAEANLDWVVRLHRHNPHSHLLRCTFYLRRERLHDARLACADALAVQADFPPAHRALAQLCHLEGDPGGALSHLQQAGDDSSVRYDLVSTALSLGEVDIATAAYTAWLEQESSRERARAGTLLARREAVDDWLRVLARLPRDDEANQQLLVAARASCRTGIAWRWLAHLEAPERTEQVGPGCPVLPTGSDCRSLRAWFEANPTDPALHEALQQAGLDTPGRMGAVDASFLVENGPWSCSPTGE